MRMRRKRPALAALFALFALCLLPPLIASAQQYVAWESDPEQNAQVKPGDRIRYAFTAEEAAAAKDWTALRVQLGDGLLMREDSVAFEPADQPAASPGPGPEHPPGTGDPGIQDVQWEIVPGNDGFVLLLSALNAGDRVSFAAVVQAEGEVAAAVRTDAFSSEISHTLVIPPTPAPEPTPAAT
ncbi:MAG TPA: hypothetical protein VN366_12970, partial [Feifaniaceae bacterium]|nr:hypothetical protein [Feifaniaceae bacterium]